MKVDTMRLVDKYVGIPICIILSLWHSFIRFLGLKKPSSKRKNFLFIELAEMGSTIISYSAIKKLQSFYPDAKIYFLMFKKNAESAHILNIIPKEQVITIRDNNIFTILFDATIRMIELRLKGIDVVFDMELFSRVGSILSYLSGAKERVGFYNFHSEGLYRGTFQTHKVFYNPYMHMSKNFLSMVYSIKLEQQMPYTKINIPDSDINYLKLISKNAAKNKIYHKIKFFYPKLSSKSKIVLINPDASALLPIRRWPIESYISLIKKILDNPESVAVIIGVNSEKPVAQQIKKSIDDDRIIDFTGETTLRELIDTFNISKLLVCNDSGTPNFASLTDIPMIVFFGPETPVLYSPVTNNQNIHIMYSNLACSPCVSAFNHRKTPCTDNKCLQAINVDEAYTLAKKYLN